MCYRSLLKNHVHISFAIAGCPHMCCTCLEPSNSLSQLVALPGNGITTKPEQANSNQTNQLTNKPTNKQASKRSNDWENLVHAHDWQHFVRTNLIPTTAWQRTNKQTYNSLATNKQTNKKANATNLPQLFPFHLCMPATRR